MAQGKHNTWGYCGGEGWRNLRRDPVREELVGRGEPPELDGVLSFFPRLGGEPAFDPAVIADKVDRLETEPAVDTGHPLLDESVKVGLAHIDVTFQGDHPKYGVKGYARPEHDSFPPTIIAAVDALSAWGLGERAAELFRYWLTHFVREDGRIDYYGPALSEYGQLLDTAALLVERAGPKSWWEEGWQALDGLAGYLLRLRGEAEPTDGLLSGSPEADTREEVGKYFHNNGWAARGLGRWAEACERTGASPSTSAGTLHSVAEALAGDTISVTVSHGFEIVTGNIVPGFAGTVQLHGRCAFRHEICDSSRHQVTLQCQHGYSRLMRIMIAIIMIICKTTSTAS